MSLKDNEWGVKSIRSKDGTPLKIKIARPSVPTPSKLTKEDVWGKVDIDFKQGKHKRISKGMIVASQAKGYPNRCPIWHDILPVKSVTAVCSFLDEPDVEYWLDYVLGTNSVSRRKVLPKGKVALRADYTAW